MEQKTLYTAIGRLDLETNGCGRSCPVIRLSGQTYMVDMQEMVVWAALNWRISKREDISPSSVTSWCPLWEIVFPALGMPA